MIAVSPFEITDAALISSTAVEETAWVIGTTYGIGDVVSKDKRKWTSLQAGNVGKTPETEPLWWLDGGPSNKWAMFDTSSQTSSIVSGVGAVSLVVELELSRFTAIGLLGVVGNTVTVTVTDSTSAVIYTYTSTTAASDGTYYDYCFGTPVTNTDKSLFGLPWSDGCILTITIAGVTQVSCGMCVVGKQIDIGQAIYGLSMPIEDRGKNYLDLLGNPVIIERGYSKGCSGTLISTRKDFNRLMDFYANNVSTPCLYVAAPGKADLVAATVFGKLSRVVPAITGFTEVTTSIEISGYR